MHTVLYAPKCTLYAARFTSPPARKQWMAMHEHISLLRPRTIVHDAYYLGFLIRFREKKKERKNFLLSLQRVVDVDDDRSLLSVALERKISCLLFLKRWKVNDSCLVGKKSEDGEVTEEKCDGGEKEE